MPLSRMRRTVSIMRSVSVGLRAGEHLVEQQQPRARAERAREFEPLLAGGGERAGEHVEPVAEPDQFGDFARDLARLVERQILAAEAGADGAIVEHGQSRPAAARSGARAQGRGARRDTAARR